RILSRASGVWDEDKINGYLANIPDEAFITDDVGINPGYSMSPNKLNPMWATFATDATGAVENNNGATPATQYVVEFFKATTGYGGELDSTRFNRIFEIPPTGAKGVDQGFPNSEAALHGPPVVSNLGYIDGVNES